MLTGNNLNYMYLWRVVYYRGEPSSHLVSSMDLHSETGCVSFHEAFYQWPDH